MEHNLQSNNMIHSRNSQATSGLEMDEHLQKRGSSCKYVVGYISGHEGPYLTLLHSTKDVVIDTLQPVYSWRTH
jgi:hypothetical protein